MQILKREQELYINNMKDKKNIFIYRNHPDINFGQIGIIAFENGNTIFIPDGQQKGYVISLDHVWLCSHIHAYEAFNAKLEQINEIRKK